MACSLGNVVGMAFLPDEQSKGASDGSRSRGLLFGA